MGTNKNQQAAGIAAIGAVNVEPSEKVKVIVPLPSPKAFQACASAVGVAAAGGIAPIAAPIAVAICAHVGTIAFGACQFSSQSRSLCDAIVASCAVCPAVYVSQVTNAIIIP
jgi:hypothetical protein